MGGTAHTLCPLDNTVRQDPGQGPRAQYNWTHIPGSLPLLPLCGFSDYLEALAFYQSSPHTISGDRTVSWEEGSEMHLSICSKFQVWESQVAE